LLGGENSGGRGSRVSRGGKKLPGGEITSTFVSKGGGNRKKIDIDVIERKRRGPGRGGRSFEKKKGGQSPKEEKPIDRRHLPPKERKGKGGG